MHVVLDFKYSISLKVDDYLDIWFLVHMPKISWTNVTQVWTCYWLLIYDGYFSPRKGMQWLCKSQITKPCFRWS